MSIDRGCAGIHPQARGADQTSNGLPEQSRTLNSGFLDRSLVRRGISAIHTPAHQIDEEIGTLQLGSPIAQRGSIPLNHPPWRGLNRSRDHYDLVAALVEV